MNTAERVGAFFDIDGTLLPWPSLEWRFVAHLAWRGFLGPVSLARQLGKCIEDLVHGCRLKRTSREYLTGLPARVVSDWVAERSSSFCVFDEGLQRLMWHAQQGHRMVLVSGTLAPLAHVFATQLPVQQLETYTTNLHGEHARAMSKAHIVRAIASKQQIDLTHSFAYGNSVADAVMLASVGYPRAINPSLGLRRIAASRRWTIEYWRWRTASHHRSFVGQSDDSRIAERSS
jgi:phosphoserine phosphatase